MYVQLFSLFFFSFFSGLAFHQATQRQKAGRQNRTGIADVIVYGKDEERVAVTIPEPSEREKEGNPEVELAEAQVLLLRLARA